MSIINTEKVESFFDSIKDKDIQMYNEYWGELKPQSASAIFKRYLFAFMSVHTSWKNNCKGYNAIKEFRKWKIEDEEPQLRLWNYNSDDLFKRIRDTRVGMQNNRTNYIGKFSDAFWGDPSDYLSRNSDEGWGEWRDRLAKNILGLGKAKTSFAIEMMFPLEAQVVCMDTHLFQIYNLNQSKDAKLYDAIEADWLDRSEKRGLAPYMARCLYWDKNQNRKNSRYWSKVLEA
jgi:hypothetical protein